MQLETSKVTTEIRNNVQVIPMITCWPPLEGCWQCIARGCLQMWRGGEHPLKGVAKTLILNWTDRAWKIRNLYQCIAVQHGDQATRCKKFRS